MNAKNFGKTLLKLRKKKGITQSELAEMLSISDKTVSKWETGYGYPEITQLPTLADVFGVPIDFLFKGDTKGIAIAGNILVDIVNSLDRYPEVSMLANVMDTVNAVGGCVPNTIIDIAKIDPDVFLTAIGRVGNDDHGRFVLGELKKHGIDTSKIKISSTAPTANSNVMQDTTTGTRTFFLTSGANGEFCIDDIDVDKLDCSIFHAGYVFLLESLDAPDDECGTKMARLLKRVSDKGIKTSLDAISTESEKFAQTIRPALKHCDYVILNEIESCKTAGVEPRYPDGTLNMENIHKAMEAIIDYGVREKVIVHCTEAGFLMNADKEFIAVPSLKLPKGYIKGSVGAGDAYAAGCLYGIYNGYDDRYLLEFASATAAANLSEADSVSGMKKRSEIEELMNKYERQELEV
ncbi:MAG: helix-turn-helix domain-containing protein [Clostridia bacterium]|nr:helix-turn-helix domain-containing protein [Clostridia bacterium]